MMQTIFTFLNDHYITLLVITISAFVLPRILGAISGAGGAAAPGATDYLKRIGDAIGIVGGLATLVGFMYTPKEFHIVLNHDNLLLDQVAELNARVRQKDSTDSPLQTYRCRYSLSPAIPTEAFEQDTGCKLTITNLPKLFDAGQKSPISLQVSADHLGWPWEGPEPVQLNLYNVAKPRIIVEGAKYPLGSNVPIKVIFGDSPAPPDVICVWSPADHIKRTASCETQLVVPREGSALSSKRIDVSATVIFDYKKFATESVPIEILAPPPHLFQVVLDVSGRMGIPLSGGSQQSFFQAARDALVDEIKLFSEQGGWLSIIGFGDPVAPPNAKSCDEKVASIYSLAVVDPSIAELDLRKLDVGGADAPLFHAIDRAVDEYRINRPLYADSSDEKTFVFVVITDGTAQCDVANLLAAMRRLSAAFDQRGLIQHHYSRGSLSFAISRDRREARLTFDDPSYKENRTILFLVKNDQELREIIQAIRGLFSRNPTVRKSSCQRLGEPLDQLGDQIHSDQLRRSRPCS